MCGFGDQTPTAKFNLNLISFHCRLGLRTLAQLIRRINPTPFCLSVKNLVVCGFGNQTPTVKIHLILFVKNLVMCGFGDQTPTAKFNLNLMPFQTENIAGDKHRQNKHLSAQTSLDFQTFDYGY